MPGVRGLWERAIRPGDSALTATPPGVAVEGGSAMSGGPPSRVVASPWAGWPSDWQTPSWGPQLAVLTDTAWACLDLNSSVLASMPPYLVDPAPTLNADWVTNPDPDVYTCWEEFAKQLFWDYQAAGEVFVVVTARYATGWPARFHVVPPWAVTVELVGGRRRYEIGSAPVPDGDMLHIRYLSSTADPHGHGPLEVGAGRLVAGQVLARYGSNVAAQGGVLSSILTHPDELTADQAAALQQQWIDARNANLGAPAVLSGGVTWETVQLNPEQMALVDLSKWNESRVAVLLGVPPFLVGLPSGGDSMTYSNVVSLFDYHWRASLRPKASAVMGALSGWALPRGTQVELNRDAYIQPDPYTRAQTEAIYNTLGVLSVDEIRAVERFDQIAAAPIYQGVLK
jgi:HK97 family phage portal protein